MIFKVPSDLHILWFYDDSMKNNSWKHDQSIIYQDSEH